MLISSQKQSYAIIIEEDMGIEGFIKLSETIGCRAGRYHTEQKKNSTQICNWNSTILLQNECFMNLIIKHHIAPYLSIYSATHSHHRQGWSCRLTVPCIILISPYKEMARVGEYCRLKLKPWLCGNWGSVYVYLAWNKIFCGIKWNIVDVNVLLSLYTAP